MTSVARLWVCGYVAAMLLIPAVRVQGNPAVHIERDAAGIPVILDAFPKRIVVVGPAGFIPLHLLYMFEETLDRLAGFEVRTQTSDEFLKLVDPQFSFRAVLRANPGPESVAALKPDLVIMKSLVAGNLTRSLTALGIPVLHIGAETPELFLTDIDMLGKVLGNENRARAIIGFYEDRMARIADAVGAVPETEKPRVLVLEYSNRGKDQALNVPSAAWIQTRQAVMAGGHPVWTGSGLNTDGWQITGFEQIAAWNPDKIFLIVWFQFSGSRILASLYESPKWQKLTAVRQQQMFLFPRDIFGWDSASPRWILGALWMAGMTHPQKFQEMDVRDMTLQFYSELYGLDDAVIIRHLLPETGL